jgi:hypothetical protein
MKNCIIAVVALFILSCATANQFHTDAPQKYTANLLTEYEISHSSIAFASSTVYDVIRSLRPAFLNSRGCQAAHNGLKAEPVVYLDGIRLSGTDNLRRIFAMNIAEIRFLTPLEAATFYGGTNPCGLLLIASRTQ